MVVDVMCLELHKADKEPLLSFWRDNQPRKWGACFLPILVRNSSDKHLA